LRRFARSTLITVRQALQAWTRYGRRVVRFALIALLFALADRNLIAAWRANGLGVLATYIPLMLYVYARLLFDRRVPAWTKAFLFGALAYGVLRRDLIPDRNLIPGSVEDVLLIFVAVRLLLRWCTDEVVDSIAAEAVNWRRRLAAFQRARQR
jgi:uncharacterized membrane protein YkvA (DUF1232 family)